MLSEWWAPKFENFQLAITIIQKFIFLRNCNWISITITQENKFYALDYAKYGV